MLLLYHIKQVNAYVEVTAHSNANDIGLVRAAFAASIQEELTDYYRLLAVMEAQLGCDINPMQVSTSKDYAHSTI